MKWWITCVRLWVRVSTHINIHAELGIQPCSKALAQRAGGLNLIPCTQKLKKKKNLRIFSPWCGIHKEVSIFLHPRSLNIDKCLRRSVSECSMVLHCMVSHLVSFFSSLHTDSCCVVSPILGWTLFIMMGSEFSGDVELFLHAVGNQLGLEFNVSANPEIPIQNLALLDNRVLSRELGLQKSMTG